MSRNICGLRLVLFILVALVVADAAPKRYHSFMGPFTIKVRRLTRCPEELDGKFHIEHYVKDVRTKYDQKVTYSGNLTQTFPVNDSLGVSVRHSSTNERNGAPSFDFFPFKGRMLVASWSQMGGWKDNAHILHFKAVCKTTRTLAPKLWDDYMNSVVGEHSMCPYYAGYYRFSNVTVDFSKIGISQFLYGRWRADLQMIHSNGDIAACMRAFADTVPV